ncbi:hypothetical protein E4T47_09321 [Aureobasidium subglaciale]|nr:hypothetical protein E4T47_09321 [Aureobasidium subglaciale]
MLPFDYGSAHSRAPESTTVVPSFYNSEEPSKAFKGAEKAIVKRSINFDAETSSGRDPLPRLSSARETAETSKRRCAVAGNTQQQAARQDVRSDFARALFNPVSSDTTSGQTQTMGNLSRPFLAMATNFGPSASYSFASSIGASANGFVHRSAPHNALTGPYGPPNNSDKHASSGFTAVPRDTSHSAGAFGIPFTPQPTGFQIPGLGAPLRSVDPDDSKKAQVTSPGVARPRQPGPHTRITTGTQSVLSPVLESAPESCSNPTAQLQHKSQPPVVSHGSAVTNRNPSPAKQNSSNAPVSTPSKAALTPKHASADAGAAPEVSVTACPSGLVRIPKHLRPSDHADVWIERQSYRTFKLHQAENDARRFETFDGAYQILSGINPGHYSMPYGSMVVAIKCPILDDILISHITGLWATNQNVMGRIMELHGNRGEKSAKTLFLWSMPGSKHFCGLAELQAFNPEPRTEIYDKEAGRNVTIFGALVIQWIYCKLVPFEDVVPVVEGKIDQGSVTQMWNGMYYNEATGREVVKSYVEAPHVENMLAAPTGEFFRRAMENSKVATVPPSAPRYPTRGGLRSQQRGSHASNQSTRGGGNSLVRRGNFQNSKVQIRPQPAHQSATISVPVIKEETEEAKHTTQTDSTSPENKRHRGQPQLQMIPVLKYADGSMTTAPNMHGSIASIAPHGSVVGNQNVRAHESNSAVQTKCVTLDSSNVPAVMHTPVTMGTSFPSQGQIANHLSGSVFDVSGSAGNHSYSFAMPPPRKPFMSQQVAASQSEGPESSTPRTLASLDRNRTDLNAWLYYGSPEKTPTQPKTPVRQPDSSHHLTGSPMDIIKHRTPTLRDVRSSLGSNRVSPQKVGAYSYGQLPPKIRTPESSPIEVRLKSDQSVQPVLPAQPITPRPAGRRVAAERLDENGNYNPMWIHMLVDDE